MKTMIEDLIKEEERSGCLVGKAGKSKQAKNKHANVQHKIAVPVRPPTEAELQKKYDKELFAAAFCMAVAKVGDEYDAAKIRDLERQGVKKFKTS